MPPPSHTHPPSTHFSSPSPADTVHYLTAPTDYLRLNWRGPTRAVFTELIRGPKERGGGGQGGVKGKLTKWLEGKQYKGIKGFGCCQRSF